MSKASKAKKLIEVSPSKETFTKVFAAVEQAKEDAKKKILAKRPEGSFTTTEYAEFSHLSESQARKTLTMMLEQKKLEHVQIPVDRGPGQGLIYVKGFRLVK